MPTAQQAQQHRAEVAALTALAVSEVRPVFAEFDTGEAVRNALLALLPQLYLLYGVAVATISADWYDDLRETDGVRGRFTAIPSEVDVDTAGLEELVHWGVDPLFRSEPDPQAAQSLVEGGLQRRLTNIDRDTIIGSIDADPVALGYARHARPDACAFCAMLATRGDAEGYLYATEESATRVVGRGTDLAANQQRRMGRQAEGVKGRGTQALGSKYHDDCNCVAVPVFEGTAYDPAPYVAEWQAAYDKAFKQLTPGTEHYTSELLSNMRQILGTN